MAHSDLSKMKASMVSIGLKTCASQLGELLDQAEKEQMPYRRFLDVLIDTETDARNRRRVHRNFTGAHFPPQAKSLDEFNTAELESGLTATQLMQLRELNWADAAANIIFLGPPGLGKTMLAVGLGLEAVNQGYAVCFERMQSLVDMLTTEHTSRASAFRLKRIRKCGVLIVDEVGFLPVTKEQANAFFSLVSELYEQTSIIITTNREIDQWAEMLGDPVLTTALLDRLLYNAKCFSLKGESYRIKHPKEEN